MAEGKSRQRIVAAIIVLVLILLLLLLLLPKCMRKKGVVQSDQSPSTQPIAAPAPAASVPATTEPAEELTPATLSVPQEVVAGATFAVTWTGPDNRGDFISIVQPTAAAPEFKHYEDTRRGSPLNLTSPIEPGEYEVRYVTGRSHTVLGRTPIKVVSSTAAIEAPVEVVLGSQFEVKWTGPNNKGDYITVVPANAADAQYGSYVDADKASPQMLTAPPDTGDAELRYVTGQGKQVLARRPIKVVTAQVSLEAPAEAIAGSNIDVIWNGPNNAGDYITVVTAGTPDGQYANYSNTSTGKPLKLLLPIMDGPAELRYMTGQGNRVLARRAIVINAAKVTLSAPSNGKAGTDVSVTWTGPSNSGDYITIVPKATPDGQYAAYTNTTKGSPLTVQLPKVAGDAEVRYMTGQGNKVLARIPITVTP